MEVMVAAVTVKVVVAEIFPKVAVIVVEPFATAVDIPLASIVATVLSDELQVTCAVKS